jgi:hypothetical protein
MQFLYQLISTGGALQASPAVYLLESQSQKPVAAPHFFFMSSLRLR